MIRNKRLMWQKKMTEMINRPALSKIDDWQTAIRGIDDARVDLSVRVTITRIITWKNVEQCHSHRWEPRLRFRSV
jgi:hypothetical protein